MFFDRSSGFDDLEVTSTVFRATVSEDEPFNFALYASQDIHASVRITHLFYTPPNSLSDLRGYYNKKLEACKTNGDLIAFLKEKDQTVSDSSSLSSSASQPPRVVSVVAKVRSLTADNSTASFVIACFPLDLGRVTDALDGPEVASSSQENLTSSSLAALFNGVRVMPSDIAEGLNIRLDVDGSVGLEVEGPGRVTFLGEQLSALIPEWMNHHMFSVSKDDEEMPEDDSEDEFDEMYRLIRY